MDWLWGSDAEVDKSNDSSGVNTTRQMIDIALKNPLWILTAILIIILVQLTYSYFKESNLGNRPQELSTNWTICNHFTKTRALNFLTKPNDQASSNEVLKYKIIIDENFEELSTTDLTKLKTKFANQSFVLFITANKGTRFHIYWKSKNSQQILSLKPYNNYFAETDKDLCKFVAEFLADSLTKGQSGLQQDLDISTINGQIELHLLANSRNCNLLLLASEFDNVKVVEALLKYGINPQVNLKAGVVTAQDLAWQRRHSDVLLTLLQANLPFPADIDINECSEELKVFIMTCQDFHKMIEEKNNDKIDKILKQKPNLRYFYNLSNKSALKAALDQKLINIYELLISKNLQFAPHEDTDKIWEQFTKSEKIKLGNINFKYSKHIPEKHINILMFNSFISHDEPDEEGKRKLILRAYKALNTDPRLKIILKIVAATKVFQIIFDFHRSSTNRIDPLTGSGTQGICYFTGRIIVGAKRLLDPDKEQEGYGVLIHELCHYAMVAVYQNKACPYKIKDQEAKEEFDRIIKKCKENAEVEEIIGSVYEYYTEAQYPVELIVRPPHLIALYSKEPEMLQFVIDTFNELFNHYLNVVVPAMERALQEIEGRLVYKPTHTFAKLSDQDKDKVQNASVKYKTVKVKFVELFPGNSDILEHLTSDHISLMLDNKVINFDDPQFHYLEEQIVFKWENLAGNFREKFLDSNLNFQGEDIKFNELNNLYPEAFNALTSQQIIDVLSGSEIKIGKEFVSEIKFYVERKFISEDAKLIWFEYAYGHEYVDNYETRVEHVKNRTKDKSFQEFSDELLKKDFDEISQLFDKVKENSVFKTRHFNLNLKSFHFMHQNSNEIIEQAEKEKILILSSEAGAGKTVTFEQLAMEIKSKFSTRWVSYLDLPKCTKFYKSNGTAENFLKDILDLNSEKNNFEVRIFEESFKSGNLVLIWNAFDEISPTFYDFVLNLLKFIKETPKNVQFVCTRPLYSDQLSKAFKVRTWQLLPFDEKKKKEFLREFFIFENVASEKVQENIEKVEKIIEKLKFAKIPLFYNFETPLMLKLIAEIHENKNLFESANIFGIFKAFVEKKIEIWLKKNENSLNSVSKLLFSGSLKIILQKFALLNELNLFSYTTLGLKMRKLQIMQKEIPKDFSIEEISKMGILFINGKNNFQFSHATLSEFFVAQYFIENIFNIDGAVDSDEAELRLELFYHLTQSYGVFQQIITDFMTSYLQMRPQEPKKFNPTISRLLRTKFKNFFIRMLDTNYPKVFEFLFEFFNPDHDLLVDLLHVHKPETFYTAIFNPNHFALFTNPEEIKSLARNCLTDAEFQKFLTGKNQKGKILFGIHFYGLLGVTKSNDVYSSEIKALSGTSFWNFFPKIKDYLTIEEQKELFVAALSPKIYLFYDKMFSTADFSEYEKLWTNFENLLTQNEMQNAFGDALVLYFEIHPSWFANHEKFLNLLLETVEKFLSNSQIFEMFLTKNILHEAHWISKSFEILWNFLSSHTNEQERGRILLKDDFDDKNFYFWTSYNELKESYSKYKYQYFYYDFTPLKIFHRALTIPDFNLDFTKEIYQEHFNKSEIQEIILSSNDFIYYVIGRVFEEPFKKFVSFLEELFEGNEKMLKEFLEQKIEPTNLSVFELVEDFQGLPWSQPKWFKNLKTISDLNETIKNS